MGGAERVVDVDITELRETGAERLNLFRVGLQLGAVFQLHLALFLDVEAEVFKQNNIAGFGLGTGGLDFRADAVIEELHRAAEQILERFGNRLEGKFFNAFTVRTT